MSIYKKKSAIYGLSPLSHLNRCKFIKNIPLTVEEKNIIFIDKPIDLLPELKDYFWTSEKISSKKELFQTLGNADKRLLDTFPNIELKSFILLPFNSRDGFGKMISLNAENGLSFTSSELLLKIHNEQSNYIKRGFKNSFKNISRAGHQKGLCPLRVFVFHETLSIGLSMKK